MPFDMILVLVFPALVAFAGASDLLTMTIPNRVPLALAAGFLCLAPFAGLGAADMAVHGAVAAAALAAGILCFSQGWVGGGDAKLFAAVALWFGPAHLFEYGLVVALLGGGLTLVLLFGRMVPLPAGLARQAWLARLHDPGSGIPYGIALAAGAMLVYPETPWMSLAG